MKGADPTWGSAGPFCLPWNRIFTLAFRIAHDALKRVAKCVPRPMDWQEIEKADKMVRASGLDDGDSAKVNVTLNLVNQRILAMQEAAE
jgi:hypothetical protein